MGKSGAGAGGVWGVTAKGYEVSFGGNTNVLKLIMIMVAQFCKYTKIH